MEITAALQQIEDRCEGLRHAAEKARKAIEVGSPIRGTRMASVMYDALNFYGDQFTPTERGDFIDAMRDFVRANPNIQY